MQAARALAPAPALAPALAEEAPSLTRAQLREARLAALDQSRGGSKHKSRKANKSKKAKKSKNVNKSKKAKKSKNLNKSKKCSK